MQNRHRLSLEVQVYAAFTISICEVIERIIDGHNLGYHRVCFRGYGAFCGLRAYRLNKLGEWSSCMNPAICYLQVMTLLAELMVDLVAIGNYRSREIFGEFSWMIRLSRRLPIIENNWMF